MFRPAGNIRGAWRFVVLLPAVRRPSSLSGMEGCDCTGGSGQPHRCGNATSTWCRETEVAISGTALIATHPQSCPHIMMPQFPNFGHCFSWRLLGVSTGALPHVRPSGILPDVQYALPLSRTFPIAPSPQVSLMVVASAPNSGPISSGVADGSSMTSWSILVDQAASLLLSAHRYISLYR